MHRNATRLAAAAAAAALAGLAGALPASADSGDVDLFLADPQDRGDTVSAADIANVLDGEVPLVCDVVEDADGALPTVFDGGFWRVVDADGEVAFGRAGDVPLCGDWGFVDDEAGAQDTFAVRRGNQYFLSEQPAVYAPGHASASFSFGRPGDQALVGDWDGDGVDTIAVRRGNTVYYANANVDGGGGVRSSSYGRSTDIAVAGDFTEEGRDVVAVRRASTFYVSAGRPGERLTTALTFQYGRSTDLPVAGAPYRGEGDFLGVVRIEG